MSWLTLMLLALGFAGIFSGKMKAGLYLIASGFALASKSAELSAFVLVIVVAIVAEKVHNQR